MIPHLSHLKTKPSYIREANFSLNDFSLICKPKHRNYRTFQSSAEGMAQDPFIWMNFCKSSEFLDRALYSTYNKLSVIDFFNTKASIGIYNGYGDHPGSFFGFANPTQFLLYTTAVYALAYDHPEEEKRVYYQEELNRIGRTFYVKVYNRHPTTNIIECIRSNEIVDGFLEYCKKLVRHDKLNFDTCAYEDNTKFRDDFDKIDGKGVVFLEILGSEGFDFDMSGEWPSHMLSSYKCLPDRRTLSALRHISKESKTMIKASNETPSLLREFLLAYEKDNLGGPFNRIKISYDAKIPRCLMESVAFYNISDNPTSLDDDGSDIIKMYSDHLKLFGRIDFNCDYVGNVDDHKYYQKAIREYAKKLNIQAQFHKKMYDPDRNKNHDKRFLVDVEHEPKSPSQTAKVFKILAEIDPSAKIANRDFYRGNRNNYTPKFNTGDNMFNSALLKEYASKKSTEAFNENPHPFHKSPYYKFMSNFSTVYKNLYQHTFTIQQIGRGAFDHDPELLERTCECFFSRGVITVSLQTDDIKQLNKLKLMGLKIKKLRFYYKDRKDILEYFENY